MTTDEKVSGVDTPRVDTPGVDTPAVGTLGAVTRVGRLIGFRIDTRDPDTLKVSVVQRPLVFLLVLMCGMMTLIPVGFGMDYLGGRNPLINLRYQPLPAQALAYFALVLVSVAGPAGLIFWPIRESWVFSRSRDEAWLETRNLFGLRYRRKQHIPLSGVRALLLRGYTQSHHAFVEPVIVSRDGQAHGLSSLSVPFKERSPAVRAFLDAVGRFLGRTWPGEPTRGPEAWTAEMAKHEQAARNAHRATVARASAARNAASGKDHSAGTRGWRERQPVAPASSTSSPADATGDRKWPALSLPVRITLGLVGVFFALLGLNNTFALLSALSQGRLSYTAGRPSYSRNVIYFSEEPIWFCVTFLMQGFLLFLIVTLAYGCIRGVFQAPHEKVDKGR
ncbi:hypothetical protein ACILG0_12455 [Pseudomonadota bacterium AL_CKDN230030165-1A_HGKHYDSX7]